MKQPSVIKDICQSAGDNASDDGGRIGRKSSIPASLWVHDEQGVALYPALGGGEATTIIAISLATMAATNIVQAFTQPKPPSPPDLGALVPDETEIQAAETRAERQERLRKARAVTAQSTLLTSTLGTPIPENQLAKPTLGASIT